MIKYQSEKQLNLEGFETPFDMQLDQNNRWVKLSKQIPWDALAQSYYKSMSAQKGRPAKDARLVIGAVIIKHKQCFSDEETIEQIRENPYLQYFVGFKAYQHKAAFAPSLFVEIRKRMGQAMFDEFYLTVVDAVEQKAKPAKSSNDQPEDTNGTPTVQSTETAAETEAPQAAPTHQGKLIVDATVADQEISYPTDLGLLNQARALTERIIDELHQASNSTDKKPRTYRDKARKLYLAAVKQKQLGITKQRKAIKQQLQFVRRNLNTIATQLEQWPHGTTIPLAYWLMRRYWVIQVLYQQQLEMYQNKSTRCDDRIVNISQPHVRPIVRGKKGKKVEFGAKISVGMTPNGLVSVDKLHWDANNESQDLIGQIEAYKARTGHYPQEVIADNIYATRANRNFMTENGIQFHGKPLGRPKKVNADNAEELKQQAARRKQAHLERIPVEGKFGQGKRGYRLNQIRAKRADTSTSWINAIFFVMNLLVLQHFLRLVRGGNRIAMVWLTLVRALAHRIQPIGLAHPRCGAGARGLV